MDRATTARRLHSFSRRRADQRYSKIAKILVLGGTRFIGLELVQRLLERGDEVTVLTRGLARPSFRGLTPRFLIADREIRSQIESAIAHQKWDIVLDNSCYDSVDAEIAADLILPLTKKYVLTSTQMVYDPGSPLLESAFNPLTYPFKIELEKGGTYGPSKRNAEALIAQRRPPHLIIPRLVSVVGPGDFTERMDFYVRHILSEKHFCVVNPDTVPALISLDAAVRFLIFCLDSQDPTLRGPVNARSDGEVSIRELIEMIEQATQKHARWTVGGEENVAPFSIPDSRVVSAAKAKAAGFTFDRVESWLPEYLRLRVRELSIKSI